MGAAHAFGPSERSAIETAVREELGRILAGHEFRTSKRCQEFLTYVVEAALNGNTESLKERTIGIDVFGRPPSYDPSADSTVRVKAGEVRKRLSLYYAGAGQKDPVRIELPGGAYVPEFRVNSDGNAPSPRASRPRWLLPASLVAVALICAAAFAAWQRGRAAGSSIDDFWGPVFRTGAPASICASFVPVYGLAPDAEARLPAKLNDFVLLTDQFVGGGDLLAVAGISSLFTRMHRPYRLRLGNEATFDDLRSAPAILVGYSYTRWKEISSQMRFVIESSRRPGMITDNGAPTRWALVDLPPDRRASEDYAIVSRVFHPDTRAMLVEVAGITQYGTQAAADLVTNSDLLADAMRTAPRGWQNKNLQLVLHAKVISGVPAPPKVVASYFW